MATIYIKPDPINTLNFLRWYEPVAGPFDGITFAESGECLQVQATYPQAEADYALPMVSLDSISFAVNVPKNFGAANLLHLFFLQDNTFTEIPGVTFAYVTAGDGLTKYLTATFSVPELPNGRYNLALALEYAVFVPGNPAIWGKNVVAVSNPVRITNNQSAQHPTVWAEFRHSSPQFGYPYDDPTFANRFRLDALITAGRPVENIATYEDSNRKTRFIGQGVLERVSAFKTDYLDQGAHEAMAAMFLHNDIALNGREYAKTEAYETELDNDFYSLYQGQTTLKDLGFTATANACTPAAPIPPEE